MFPRFHFFDGVFSLNNSSDSFDFTVTTFCFHVLIHLFLVHFLFFFHFHFLLSSFPLFVFPFPLFITTIFLFPSFLPHPHPSIHPSIHPIIHCLISFLTKPSQNRRSEVSRSALRLSSTSSQVHSELFLRVRNAQGSSLAIHPNGRRYHSSRRHHHHRIFPIAV